MHQEYQYSFEKLKVWQNARALTLEVYQITEKLPPNEKFGLTDQIRRAAISISSNLAEGSSRITSKDQAHFSNMAYSSLMELLSHFYLAFDLNYIDKDIFENVKQKINEISNKLNALRNYQLKRN
ncbi:four helix bundle protein [Melioribacter sp. OK-6-Me]|uniref:four helix bundle protein n=1 Tax=Melioribacter sp. OK-6-Me TaxID=3423433 RepID=UPI003EDB3265